MFCITFRRFCFFIFLFCVLLLLGAIVIEHLYFLPPCPLCTIQRICYLFVASLALIGFVHNPKSNAIYLYLGLSSIVSIAGLATSGWQVWLQFFADKTETLSCSSGLFEILESHEAISWLKIIFSPNVDCADISFKVFYLTLAEWSFICFLLLTIGCFVGTMWLKKKVRL